MKNGVIALWLFLLLSGCSVKFAYNKLDWWIAWYVDDYVELTAEQQPVFDRALKEWLQTHRQQHLPEYAKLIHQMRLKVDEGWGEQDVAGFQQDLLRLMTALSDETVEPLAGLLLQLTEDQVLALQKGLDRSNQKFREKFILPDAGVIRKKQAQNLVKQIERFTGSLNPQQVKKVKDWSEQYHLLGEISMASRLRWQADFVKLLQNRHQLDLKTELAWLLQFPYKPALDAGEYQQKRVVNQQLIYRLLADLSHSLDTKQREKLKRSLAELEFDFYQLAQR